MDDYNRSLAAFDSYFGWMTDVKNSSVGGGILGADRDIYMNAVRNGYKGSVQDFENGIYRDKKILKDGTTIYIYIDLNPKHVNTPVNFDSQVQCEVLVFGRNYSEYNFVQTWFDNNDRNGPPSYTWKLDGRNPHGFYNDSYDNDYYSLPTFLSHGKHPDGYFEDSPNDLYNFQAEWTLCGKKGNTWVEIESFSWGYNFVDGGKIPYFIESNNSNSDHRVNLQKTLNYYNTHY